MPFQFTQPDFYNEYRSARNIVDTGGNRKSKNDDPPVDDLTIWQFENLTIR